MSPTCSVETKLENFIALRDTSTEFISTLAQMYDIPSTSTSRLLAARRGRSLPQDAAALLEKLLDDLENFCISVHPIPVNLRNPIVIKPLLDEFRQRTEQQRRPIPFSVILIGGMQLFQRVTSDGRVETTSSYQDCAAFKDGLVALKAAKLLEPMTNGSLRVTQISNMRRPQETISDRLEDFGFEPAAQEQVAQ